MKEKKNTHALGTRSERVAAEYLVRMGYRILEQSYHAGRLGEIDIIAEDPDGVIVFCECKYRQNKGSGDPLEAVTQKKQQQICRTAMHYYALHGYGVYTPCRFDVLGIYPGDVIRHIPNAFFFRSGRN